MRRLLAGILSMMIVLGFTNGCVLPRDQPRADATEDSPPEKKPTVKIPIVPTLVPLDTLLAPTPLPGLDADFPKAASGRPKYILKAIFSPEERSLEVVQSIDYPNQTGGALDAILLLVETNRIRGAFSLQSLRVNHELIANPELDGARLWLRLPAPLQPGTSLHIDLIYQLIVPEIGGAFGSSPRQINFGDWYPYVPPYTSRDGWMAHEPTGVGEHLAYDLADFEVEISLSGEAEDWKVVASALAEGSERTGLIYHQSSARNFTWSASPLFDILSRPAGEITLVAAVFPQHTAAGEAAMRTIADALVLYANQFGSYPHASLTLVDADFFDGMEYDGLFFLDQTYFQQFDGSAENYLTALSAHETAHQWWYGLVANDPAREPWLDESLCTFSELMYYEEFQAKDTTWWWGFRIGRFHPQGWVNSSIDDHANFRPYVDAVYLRGALFLQALRDRMGNEDFYAFLKEYATRFRNSRSTGTDFFEILKNYSAVPEDLQAQFFRPQ